MSATLAALAVIALTAIASALVAIAIGLAWLVHVIRKGQRAHQARRPTYTQCVDERTRPRC